MSMLDIQADYWIWIYAVHFNLNLLKLFNIKSIVTSAYYNENRLLQF